MSFIVTSGSSYGSWTMLDPTPALPKDVPFQPGDFIEVKPEHLDMFNMYKKWDGVKLEVLAWENNDLRAKRADNGEIANIFITSYSWDNRPTNYAYCYKFYSPRLVKEDVEAVLP